MRFRLGLETGPYVRRIGLDDGGEMVVIGPT